MRRRRITITILIFIIISLINVCQLQKEYVIAEQNIGLCKYKEGITSFLELHDPIRIYGNDDFTTENGIKKGHGTFDDPYVISGWNIITSNTSGIIIENTTACYNINNCTIQGVGEEHSGIDIHQSANGKISDVTCINYRIGISMINTNKINIFNNSPHNNNWGMYFISSNNCTIIKNNISSNNFVGLQMEDCSYSHIENNIAENNGRDGIYLVICHNSQVINNSLFHNNQAGLFIDHCINNSISKNMIGTNVYGMLVFHYSDDNFINENVINNNIYNGLSFLFSNYNKIHKNDIRSNGFIGIGFYPSNAIITGCYFNKVSRNNISNNAKYGIYADYAENNYFFSNNIMDNNGGQVQACDENGSNSWYMEKVGNYWNDWTSPDENGDGIVDEPYFLDGEIDAKDPYPRVHPIDFGENSLPVCKIDYPNNGKDVSGKVEIRGSAFDLDGDLLKVEVRIGEGGWLDANGSSTWFFYWNSSLVPNGIHSISSRAFDGNGYSIIEMIYIKVNNSSNEPLTIITKPITETYQGDNYYVQFNVNHQENEEKCLWTMDSDATFLRLNNTTGVLFGIPGNNDVGRYNINITAEDERGRKDWLDYSLEVINVNDFPIWSSIPSDTKIDQGEYFTFAVEAEDVDVGDIILYSISSKPSSSISIDSYTGEITWLSSIESVTQSPDFMMTVEVSATDGNATIIHEFVITVIPNPPPISTILSPDDEARITSEGILLEWKGMDDGEEPLKYDIYLGESYRDISIHERSVLWLENIEETSVNTGRVEMGKTYYWTVIPKDAFSSGICINDIFSFTVNIPPSIKEFTVPVVYVGDEFRVNLMGLDLNSDDLEFSLEKGPNGMKISNRTVTWTPSESQVGTHTVNLSLSDGYETVYKEFEIEVSEKVIPPESEGEVNGEDIPPGPKKGFSSLIIILIIIVVFLPLVGLGSLFFFLNKKRIWKSEEPDLEGIAP